MPASNQTATFSFGLLLTNDFHLMFMGAQGDEL
jgi:hypothetical protein